MSVKHIETSVRALREAEERAALVWRRADGGKADKGFQPPLEKEKTARETEES